MNVYQLKCPACGAGIDVEQKQELYFCPYCGSKIYLDDGVERTERTENINYHKTYTDEAKIKDIEAKERMNNKQLQEEREDRRRKENSKIIPVAALCLLLVVAMVFMWGTFRAAKMESDRQEAALQAIVEEVMQDIKKGEFASARIKAETIYYTEEWSHDIEEKWDNTRKELIKQIKAAEKEANEAAKEAEKEENEPKEESDGTWWNPFD